MSGVIFKRNLNHCLKTYKNWLLRKYIGGIKVWYIQHRSLIIDAIELTKYRRLLVVIVCIITLIPIKKFFATHHSI
jgi:hypothetical protein